MTARICTRCDVEKKLEEFYRNHNGPSGRLTRCKNCDNELKRKKYREDHLTRAKAVWHALGQRVGNADGKNPTYANIELRMTKEEFCVWYTTELPKFFDVYGETVTPSIDRLRVNEHYELSNLRLLPLGENARLQPKNHNVNAPGDQAWCAVCKCYKNRDAFYRSKAQPHGLDNRCKACVKRLRVSRKVMK